MELRGKSIESWENLFQVCEKRVYKAGSAIFLQGEYRDKFFVLKEGICKGIHYMDSGSLEKTFSLLSGISFLGASAHICKLDRYPISMIAYTDVTVCIANWDDAYAVFQKDPELMHCLLKSLSGELNATYNQYSDSFSDIKYRIARFLMLQGEYGMLCYHDYQKETDIRIPQEMIASILGVGRPTVSIALQELEKMGLIKKEYRCIKIVSQEKLIQYCESFYN